MHCGRTPRSAPRKDHWSRLTLCTAVRAAQAAILTLLGACSVNGVGMAHADVERGDGAVVVTTRALGAQLRAGRGGGACCGLSLGYDRLVLVYPEGPAMPAPGRYPFGVAWPEAAPVLLESQVLGLLAEAGPSAVGLTLGLAYRMAVRPIGAADSVRRSIRYVAGNAAGTRVRMCEGEEATAC